ncbi:MAG: imidazoleglycerol-phosphate dehydratase HisB [Spirochaetaceae bacterium]|jgi:imidazoleglycerol-phosphate dehydratase|nr:imidazoleglycerol-phosphate dehydratase HisB [Spirochaetaceae bacterium]
MEDGERAGTITRGTKETDITIKLTLDGEGRAKLDYPVGFMGHMLNTFARHGLFDLEVRAKGDLEVDQHHLVEDTGIVLGQCFARALGDKRGIRRTGSCLFPMDETLARAAVDISGRPFLVFKPRLSGIPMVSASPEGKAVSFQTDTVEDFWRGFTSAAGFALHLDILRGRSDHHKIEALFKAAARALRDACETDPRAADRIPSTKGVLGGFPGVIV